MLGRYNEKAVSIQICDRLNIGEDREKRILNNIQASIWGDMVPITKTRNTLKGTD